MKKFFLSQYPAMLFILLVGAFSYFYHYDRILKSRPSIIHQYRQTDCLSFTYNYYKLGNDFFEPQVNMKTGTDFSGKNASEFPILYYLVAQFWKLFGYHEWIYRLFFVLIMFAGLFALFRIFQYFLKDTFWQVILPLWLFTSPVMIYYGNNFLTDVPALSFVFIGWYFFIRYLKKQQLISLIFVLAFFGLGMLIKITSGISFLVLIALFFLERFGFFGREKKKMFPKFITTLLMFAATGLLVMSWYVYAIWYNKANGNDLFQTGIIPIWSLTSERIAYIFRVLFDYHFGNYFNLIALLVVLIFFGITMSNFKRANRPLAVVNLLIFLACISGMCLWFDAYDEHDYHLINYLIFIPATCLAFFRFLQEQYPDLYRSLKIKLPLLAVVLISLWFGHAKISARYANLEMKEKDYSALLSRYEVNYHRYMVWNYAIHYKAFETITPYLRSIGITENDLIFSLPDSSPDITLYLSGQWGITLKNETGPALLDEMNAYRPLGIRYLLLNDSTLLKDQVIRNLLSKKIGQYQNVSIYELNPMTSFNIFRYGCDAETVDADPAFFRSSVDSIRFAGTELRSEEQSKSGKYSICLDEAHRYGFTTKLKNLSAGQSVNVSVWRYAEDESEAGIVIASENAVDLYAFNARTASTKAKGWQKISQNITVPEVLNGKDLTVYVHFPSTGRKVFFDDIEISISSVPQQ